MIKDVINYVKRREAHINYLYKESPVYPEVMIEDSTDDIYASTIVRVKSTENDLYYKVHVVEQIPKHEDDAKFLLLQKLMISAAMTDKLYIAGSSNSVSELDEDQLSEEERLLDRFYYNKRE